jgi:hypothetical protein
MPRPFRVDVLTGTSDPYGSIDVKSRMSRIFTALLLLALIAGAVSAQETSEPDPRMVAVGSLSASNLYLSYLVLGTVADGYVKAAAIMKWKPGASLWKPCFSTAT